MRIIKTKQDIDVLRRAEALPAVLLDLVEDYFLLLRDELEVQAYKVAVLYDNDYLMTFFTQAGARDEEVEQWLKEQAERSCRRTNWFSRS